MRGVLGYHAHVPRYRLDRSTVAAAGRGTRAVASWDQDALTLGVEAARAALASAPPASVRALYYATTSPTYADKSDAAVVHAALGLPEDAFAADLGGSTRSAIAALRGGFDARGTALVVAADLRGGLPGSADEREGGDAAAAFIVGEGDESSVVAEMLSVASRTQEVLERWRAPGETASRVWEERFGERVLVPLGRAALSEALERAEVAETAVDHLVVTGPHARAVRRVAGAATPRAAVPDRLDDIGNTGAAHPGLLLAAALDRAAAGDTIALVHLGAGADALVFRVAGGVERHRQEGAHQPDAATREVRYLDFLGWRGLIPMEPPRRPDPEPPAGPPSFRRGSWKFGFTASRCAACGQRHMPPQLVCMRCHGRSMVDERMADTPGTIATYTVDHLAFSPSPPIYATVVDFDGGGRFRCEVADADPDAVRIGARVRMSFRRMHVARGVANYFWKACVVAGNGVTQPAVAELEAAGHGPA